MSCSSCGADNPSTHRFCHGCGSPLAEACASCGSELPVGHLFCGHCGTRRSPDGETTEAVTAAVAVDERRHVSVLFVDLVGFTTLSEARDPEAVREVLSTYFDEARTIVARYGGTIEKFIGDAVMAVWGTPVAREDDAERAVRAGLDLVAAVAAMDTGVSGAPLAARAGVVTGEAAVRLDAVDQGMVAGDVVNTAARVQSAASPGTVLVDEGTRATTAAAITYQDVGEHTLKGKADPVRLFAAARVVAGAGGALRFDGLEPPFVGRDRELRLVKELFHDSVEQSRLRFVLVSGAAGVGKSRIAWEFFKYLDGISQMALWHVGRCRSFGDGLAYGALVDMVRMRLGIEDGDDDDRVLERLRAGLDTHVGDEEERQWLLPRMAVLLGIAERVATGPLPSGESLFSAWRLFLERLAESNPVVLFFEDFHHADQGLLDFVEQLLNWSTAAPIFVLALTRPESLDEQEQIAGHRRNVTTLHIEPLAQDVVSDMIHGMVRGMPASLAADLAAHAEGIPLFAVETIRMLIDRDQVIPEGGTYVLTSPLTDAGELGVPPTFQAITAARLDQLPDSHRAIVLDAAVLGLSFTLPEIQHLVGATGTADVDAVEGLLAELVRRDVLTMHADARASDPGHYRFVQKVMQAVAYETISRRDRKSRHLAVARHLGDRPDADETSGQIGRHLLAAADAVPEDGDADGLRGAAAVHLEQAGDRARRLAAYGEAQRYYENALAHVQSDEDRARLSEAAASAAYVIVRSEAALDHAVAARAHYEAIGDVGGIVRATALQGDVLNTTDRTDDALTAMLSAQESLWDQASASDRASLGNSIATALMSKGEIDEATRWLDITIEEAEASGAWELLARAMNVRGQTMLVSGQRIVGRALLVGSLELAVEHDLPLRCTIQSGNLAIISVQADLAVAREYAEQAQEYARRCGSRFDEGWVASVRSQIDIYAGRWDEAPIMESLELGSMGGVASRWSSSVPTVLLSAWRGTDEVGTDGYVSEPAEDVQGQIAEQTVHALRATRDRDWPAALRYAHAAVEVARSSMRIRADEFPIYWSIGVDAALALGRLDDARALVDVVLDEAPGQRTPLIVALMGLHQTRLRAADSSGQFDPTVASSWRDVVHTLGELGHVVWRTKAMVDLAEWLALVGHLDEAREVAAEAGDACRRWGAAPWLERLEPLLAPATAPTAAPTGAA